MVQGLRIQLEIQGFPLEVPQFLPLTPHTWLTVLPVLISPSHHLLLQFPLQGVTFSGYELCHTLPPSFRQRLANIQSFEFSMQKLKEARDQSTSLGGGRCGRQSQVLLADGSEVICIFNPGLSKLLSWSSALAWTLDPLWLSFCWDFIQEPGIENVLCTWVYGHCG